MYIYLSFFGIGVFCVAVMVVVVARKFPQLSLIDTEALPEEQTAKKKREILQERVARKAGELGKRMAEAVQERAAKAGRWVSDAQKRMEEMERKMNQGDGQTVGEMVKDAKVDVKERVGKLINAAEKLAGLGDFSEAEEKFIEAISWNAKAERAYRGLADLYIATKRFDQALETLRFLYKMMKRESGCLHGKTEDECPASAAVHVDLAELSAETGELAAQLGDFEAAQRFFFRAVNLASMNPKYLDFLLENSLKLGDALTAEQVLVKLRSANPDNKKISTFEDRLRVLRG
jgi:tetratricopeptide (TPR) repeat protein